MNKKYQTFISSTFLDLKAERSALLHAILSHGSFIPSGMELFPASNSDQWTHIENVIKECDYYILIIAGRYGSVGSDGISFTQKEYRYARDLEKPILAFIRGDAENLPADKKDSDVQSIQKLNDFRREVEQGSLCKYWNNDGELIASLLISLGNLLQTQPGVGWVKGDQAIDPMKLELLRRENDKLKSDIQSVLNVNKSEIFRSGEEKTTINYELIREYPRSIDTVRKLKISWNDIFKFIGPELFGAKFDTQFNQLIRDLVASKENIKLTEIIGYEVDSRKIKMQMLALGLIQETGKALRNDGGYAPFWELTPAGKKIVSELVAEKRSST